MLIYVSVYIRAADTLYENYKTSIDNANLSVTIANSDVLLHDGRLGIVALSDDGSVTEMNAKEKAKLENSLKVTKKYFKVMLVSMNRSLLKAEPVDGLEICWRQEQL